MKKLLSFVLLILFSSALISCNAAVNLTYSSIYENADSYSAGNGETDRTVERIDIEWIAGGVTFNYHEENKIIFTETSNRETDDNEKLHYYLDGTTLRIKYAKSGIFDIKNIEKNLTVTLPESLNLLNVTVNTVSANVDFGSVKAASVELDTISGDCVLSGAVITEKLDFDAISGNLSADLVCEIRYFESDTVSGEVNLTAKKVGNVNIDTTSGDSVIKTAACPDSIELDSISGDTTMYLPQNAEFGIEFDTVSGELDSEIAVIKNGDRYVCGRGTSEFSFDTTSGNIQIKIYS